MNFRDIANANINKSNDMETIDFREKVLLNKMKKQENRVLRNIDLRFT